MSTKGPPDGGWGWIIVVAHGLIFLSTVPVVQGFGLVFKDMFSVLNLSAADGSTVMNVNISFGMVMGLLYAPLFRTYGYRKVCVGASILYSTGLILTAFATSFVHLLITYSMMASLGMGLAMSSSSLAVNAYFAKKRGRAMGLAMTITGLGPIFIPQVTSFLVPYYGLQGTILLFSGYSLHILVAAALLQPVKWHMRNVSNVTESPAKSSPELPQEESSNQIKQDVKSAPKLPVETNKDQRKRRITITVNEFNTGGSCESPTYSFPSPTDTPCEVTPTLYRWWSSGKSIDSINLGSSMKIFDEDLSYTPFPATNFNNGVGRSKSYSNVLESNSLLQQKTPALNETKGNEIIFEKKRKSVLRRAFRRVVLYYDLDLLRDPTYVNIMLGISIALFAELNFSLLTPFILSDMGLKTREIATVMSTVATADLISRGASPFIGEWLEQPPRTMYLISLVLLVINRTSILFIANFSSMLCLAVGLGIAKGIRSVYMTLVIPSHVSMERLPYASGIQSVVNGIIMTSAGPLLGLIRDYTGSYKYCIILINCVTAVTITMWVVEMLISRRRDLRKRRQENEQNGRRADLEK